MKEGYKKVLFLTIVFGILIIFTCSCQKQEASDTQPNTKKSRLIASENIELKKQLTQKDNEIARLKTSVEKCEAEKAKLKMDMEKDMETIGEEAMKTFEEYVKLEEENKQLKKEIEELKK